MVESFICRWCLLLWDQEQAKNVCLTWTVKWTLFSETLQIDVLIKLNKVNETVWHFSFSWMLSGQNRGLISRCELTWKGPKHFDYSKSTSVRKSWKYFRRVYIGFDGRRGQSPFNLHPERKHYGNWVLNGKFVHQLFFFPFSSSYD